MAELGEFVQQPPGILLNGRDLCDRVEVCLAAEWYVGLLT
jgi:hypothetical protein